MLNEIVIGKKLNAVLLVRVEASGTTKNGSFYARGTVADKTATINFICFDDETAKKICDNDNKPMQFTGLVQSDSYSGGRQLKVERAEEINLFTDISHLPIDDKAVEIEKLTTSFEQLCATFERPGFDKFLTWLKTTDYFNAPASINYHGAYEGGLLEHSLSTYANLNKLCKSFEIDIPLESQIITALFHDLCKTNFYVKTKRNVKEDGVWKSVDSYAFEDKLPLGHGEKSVIMLMKYIDLSIEETMAIRWHMGGWDESAQGYVGGKSISAAFAAYPLAVLLHMADMADNYLCGRR
ncbi:MAG: hypothetical protein WCV63_06770 [Negativicutes bacterium]|jgi:hypothetical protein